MNHRVTVSIIMSAYNPADLMRLRQAVLSVVRQSFRDWELLLYDDGSDDPAARAIREAAGLDGRIRPVRSDRNRGLAHALNACIRLAGGAYVARMDDDDISRPDRLDKQLAFLRTHPRFQWVGSNAQLVDAQGAWGLLAVPEEPQERDFLFNSPYIHPSVLFRKAVLLRHGGYSTAPRHRLLEDYEMFMRLHAAGCRGYNLQEPLLQYWEGRDSYRKRTYGRRVREMRLRAAGFRTLGLPAAAALPYVIKPLLVGALPAPVYRLIRRRRQGAERSEAP